MTKLTVLRLELLLGQDCSVLETIKGFLIFKKKKKKKARECA